MLAVSTLAATTTTDSAIGWRITGVTYSTLANGAVVTNITYSDGTTGSILSEAPVTVNQSPNDTAQHGPDGTVLPTTGGAGLEFLEPDASDVPGHWTDSTSGKALYPVDNSMTMYQEMVAAGWDEAEAADQAAMYDNSGPNQNKALGVAPHATPRTLDTNVPVLPASLEDADAATAASGMHPASHPNDTIPGAYPIYSHGCTNHVWVDDHNVLANGCSVNYLVRRFSNGDWRFFTTQHMSAWSYDSAIFNRDYLTGIRVRNLHGGHPNFISQRDPGYHIQGPCKDVSVSVEMSSGGWTTSSTITEKQCSAVLFEDGQFTYDNELASHWSATDGGKNGEDSPALLDGTCWWDNPPATAPGPFHRWWYVWWD